MCLKSSKKVWAVIILLKLLSYDGQTGMLLDVLQTSISRIASYLGLKKMSLFKGLRTPQKGERAYSRWVRVEGTVAISATIRIIVGLHSPVSCKHMEVVVRTACRTRVNQAFLRGTPIRDS